MSTKTPPLGPLEFCPGDFEMVFGYHRPEADLAAKLANRLLAERLEKAPEVYGCEKDAITKHMRWSESQWVNIHTSEPRTSHRARLVCIEKLQGK